MAGGEGSIHAELGFKHLAEKLQVRPGCPNLRHGYFYRTSLFAFPGSGAPSRIKTKPFDPGARVVFHSIVRSLHPLPGRRARDRAESKGIGIKRYWPIDPGQ